MKILIVASYNKNQYAPFITEQVESLHHAGCEIEWFGVQGKGFLGYLKVLPKLRSKIQNFKPDVIHAHYGLSCLLANMATRHVPVVSTYHGSDINLAKVRPFSKTAMRLSAWNIFVSRRIMELVGAIEGRRCSLIPCGVVLNEEHLQTREKARIALEWDSNDKKVLFAGAFDNAVKDSQLATIVVNNLSKEVGMNIDLIELKGYTRQQVNMLMCAADCLLMTSKTEGSPQVIKEAMACGCPIVSVDVGDVAERIKGLDGCYVVSSREPKDIAEALKKAMNFNGKTKGCERIVADGLTNELVAKRIIEIYENIVRQRF